jgi:hypothetical protein
MSRAEHIENCLNEMKETLELIVDGNIHPLHGCRKVLALKSTLERIDYKFPDDELFNEFRGVDSECDDFPIDPEVRKRWNEKSLQGKDRELNEYMDRVKDAVLEAARRLLKNVFVNGSPSIESKAD